jgi:5-methylcytosine-specific restriction endonuclease McrA
MQLVNIYTKCIRCGIEFRTIPYRLKIGRDKFCSKECVVRGKSLIKDCIICGKKFKVWLAHSERVKCCSRECGYKFRRSYKGNKNPAWVGGFSNCMECGLRLTQRKYKRCSRHRNIHNTGSNNKRWKGGITPINFKIRNSTQYKLWRKAVFERDNYTCVWCGDKNGVGHRVILNADHIKPFAYYPELRLNVNNGRTLCLDCHKKTPSYLNSFSKNQYVAN